MPLSVGQRQPGVAISRGNVVLFYTYEGYIYKRLFPYGGTVWGDAAEFRPGDHARLADQNGLLWVVWHEPVPPDYLNYATSVDGGASFISPVLVADDADMPEVCLLGNGFMAIVYRQVSTGDILLRTEQDNFVAVTTIDSPGVDILQIVMCSHLGRIFVVWVEEETVKYRYSEDDGVTWSTSTTLGTYTGISLLSLPTEHLLAVTEYHHTLYGMISRDNGITWDAAHTMWLPEAAIEPVLLLDTYNDVVVFSSELNIDVPTQHTYSIKLRDLPLYAFRGEVLDTWGPLNIV